MALIPPHYLDCVIALGVPGADGKKEWNATGFLFGQVVSEIEGKKRYRIFLVTNVHVLKGRENLSLRFNSRIGEPAREINIKLQQNGKNIWHAHPDENVDVAVIQLSPPALEDEGVNYSFFHHDEHTVDLKKAKEVGLHEGDGIFLLGFPLGIVGEKDNLVIVRQGTIARIRDYLAGESKTILLDVSNFPGNSGGPVVTKPEVVSIEGTKAYKYASLIGIISSYLLYQDSAISAQTGRVRIVFEENSGLAIAYSVDCILETINTCLSQPPTEDESTPASSPG